MDRSNYPPGTEEYFNILKEATKERVTRVLSEFYDSVIYLCIFTLPNINRHNQTEPGRDPLSMAIEAEAMLVSRVVQREILTAMCSYMEENFSNEELESESTPNGVHQHDGDAHTTATTNNVLPNNLAAITAAARLVSAGASTNVIGRPAAAAAQNLNQSVQSIISNQQATINEDNLFSSSRIDPLLIRSVENETE